MIAVKRAFPILVALYVAAALVFMVSLGSDTGFTANDIYFVPAVTGTAVGVFLALKLPENRMGLLMTVMAATLVTLGLSNDVIERALEQGDQLLTVISVQASDLAWIAQSVTALVLLPLWFPTGRPLNGRWAWVGRIAILSAVVAVASSFLAESVCAYDSTASDVCIEVPNPWGIEDFVGFEPLFLVPIAMAFPAVASAFVRWRRSNDLERNQIKWFLVAAVGLLVALLISVVDVNQIVNDVVFATGLTGVWVAIAVAVLKFRLYDIDRLISRTVSYGLVTGVLLAVYLAIVFILRQLLPAENELAVAASTLAVAALFNPLRRRVQEAVDRRFNRARYDAAHTIDAFSERLRSEVELPELRTDLREVVVSTVEPSHVSLWLREEAGR